MKTRILAALFAVAACSSHAAEKEKAAPEKKEPTKAPATKEVVKPYKPDTCIVSGEKLGENGNPPVVFTYKGQEIKLCCNDCRDDFDKDPAKYLKKLEK